MKKELKILFDATLYEDWSDLPEDYQRLMSEARNATYEAYAPYSHFHVGAAILLADGSILSANNQENSSYPCGACAEQSLLYYYGASARRSPIVAMAITARRAEKKDFLKIAPCGKCRQVMLETYHRQKQAYTILLEYGGGQFLSLPSIEVLLPCDFNPDILQKIKP
jgi:cytidine deaminase